MQKYNSLFNFFTNSTENANEKWLDWMNFFARYLSKYCCSTCSFSHDMLYKDSKFEIFSDFRSISMLYFSWYENNSSVFCLSKILIKSWYSSDINNYKLIYDFDSRAFSIFFIMIIKISWSCFHASI